MRRILLLTLLLSSLPTFAQDDGEFVFEPIAEPKTPFYLPRAVFLGGYLTDAGGPTLRVTWEPELWSDRTGSLLLVIEGGLSYALRKPTDAGERGTALMTFFYQHPILAGLGYRSGIGRGFHLSGHIVTGPVFTGARFDRLPTENRIAGLVEARLRAGFNLGTVEWGASAGYSSPYTVSDRFNSTPYLGGLMLGIYADWR